MYYEDVEYKSLLELFNENLLLFNIANYEIRKYESVEEFINDDKTCAKFINDLCYEGEKLYDVDDNIKVAQGRARHSVISFFMGLILADFGGLFRKIDSLVKDESHITRRVANKLLLITAVNHDYGYYSNYIKKFHVINDLGIKYDLFDDTIFQYCKKVKYEEKNGICKHKYQNIKDYYLYSQRFHKKINDKNEVNDHGIVGGLLVYDKFLKQIVGKNKQYSRIGFLKEEEYIDIDYYKVACLTICQHNIFKSRDKETDKLYTDDLEYLYHDRGYYLDNNTPLLTLLSIVDTIECVKKFSKKENESFHFQTLTVLKNVKLSVGRYEIIIDFRQLVNNVKKDDNEKREILIDLIDGHINNIKTLPTWTCYQVEQLDDYLIKIISFE